MSEFETSNSSEGFLFTIFTDSQFYDTRLKGVLNTWAKELPPSRFMAVSDKKREYPDFEHDLYEKSELPGSDVEETRCPHGHGKGGCCKVIESQILAQQRMEKDPSLEWAFFSDDDVYLQPNAVAAAVRAEAKKAQGVGRQAVGIWNFWLWNTYMLGSLWWRRLRPQQVGAAGLGARQPSQIAQRGDGLLYTM